MKSTLKTLGAIIKLNRKKQKLSQQQLSMDICAPSYLSKIENGEIEASFELLVSLLKAMNIEYLDDAQFVEREEKNFQQFHQLAMGFFTKKAIKKFEELRKSRNQYLCSYLVVEYYLAELAYYAIQKKVQNKKGIDAITQLDEIEHLMDESRQKLYYVYKAMYVKEFDKENAIDLLNRAIRLQRDGFSYFQLSEIHAEKYEFQWQIKFLEESQVCFLNEGNYRGIVITRHYLGIAYFTIQNYKEALYHYLGTINLLDTAGDVDDYIIAYKYFAIYNVAEIYFLQKKFDMMMQYCSMFIKRQEEKTEMIYGVMPYLLLTRFYMQNNESERAKEFLIQAEKYVDRVVNIEKEIEKGLIDLFRYMLDHPDYIKSKGYFDQLNHLKTSAKLSGSIYMMVLFDTDMIEYYKANRKYKEALQLIESRLITT